MVDEPKYDVAERFFRNDYHDRGMVKWQGFYLSDHTEDVEKYTENETLKREQPQMSEMTLEEVSKVLFKAFKDQGTVQYQVNQKSDLGIYAPIRTGVVKGYIDGEVFVGDSHLNIEDIRWCSLVNVDS